MICIIYSSKATFVCHGKLVNFSSICSNRVLLSWQLLSSGSTFWWQDTKNWRRTYPCILVV